MHTHAPVFRMGKPLENLNNIVKALDNPDSIVVATTVGRNVFLGLWLLQDMFQWVRSRSSHGLVVSTPPQAPRSR